MPAQGEVSALEILDRLLVHDPGFTRARILEARVREGQGHQELAASEWATIRASDDPWARIWLSAETAVAAREWGVAEQCHTELIRMHVNRPEASFTSELETRLARGRLRLDARDLAGAERDFTVAHHEFPRALAPALLLGRCYLVRQDTEAAMRWFGQFFDESGAGEKAALEVALELFWRGEDKRAIDWVDARLSSLLRERPRLYLCFWSSRSEEAIDSAEAALAHDPGDAAPRAIGDCAFRWTG